MLTELHNLECMEISSKIKCAFFLSNEDAGILYLLQIHPESPSTSPSQQRLSSPKCPFRPTRVVHATSRVGVVRLRSPTFQASLATNKREEKMDAVSDSLEVRRFVGGAAEEDYSVMRDDRLFRWTGWTVFFCG